MAGLYIHIPFCVRKCRYCDFYSVPLNGVELRAKFLDALDVEFRGLPSDFRPGTVFIGGGTPTALEPAELGGWLDRVRRIAEGVGEWSCEANPGTLTREKAKLLRDAGVNRVSLGVQSFSAENLAFLGRIHSPAEAQDAFRLLRETGFTNVNLDLMYGIPGSPREILERDLDQVINLAPEHVACYGLIFEEDTPLTRLRDAGQVEEVDDDEELAQYRLMRERLQSAGYRHYEISNFAKPGFECRHNLLYWSGGEYIGCGPAAHGHWQGTRYGNLRSVEEYVRALREGRSIHAFEEHLEPEAKARETLVMGLRRLDGFSRKDFLKQTGFDYRALRGNEIDWLCELKLLEESGQRLRLTEKGLFVSDSVFAELV
jgi:oxygen-independent coproporphyrinogen III oxidase